MTRHPPDDPRHRVPPDLRPIVQRQIFETETDYRLFYEAVIRCADVGLVVVDPDGNYVLLNEMARRLVAVAYPDGHTGKAGQVGELYARDGVSRIASTDLPSTRAARGEDFDDYEIWIGRDRDDRRALSMSARTMRNDAGERVGTVVVARDTTDSTRAAWAREDFLATISHELRTPLTSVLGYLEIVGEETVGYADPLRDHLEIAHRNAERLLRLVDELLEATRLRRGVTLNRAPTSLTELVERAVESARPSAARAEVSLTFEAVALPDISLDPDRISEVIDNLLTNAIKFTPPAGSVSVRIDATDSDAVVAVRDTGIGIPPQDQDSVFEQFFRASRPPGSAVPGMGLGLHIVKAIVEAHGGHVRASSPACSPGAEILVRLPLRVA